MMAAATNEPSLRRKRKRALIVDLFYKRRQMTLIWKQLEAGTEGSYASYGAQFI
jgi:hypothetical protein